MVGWREYLLNLLKGIPQWMWQNKIKSIIIILLLYTSHRLYQLYLSFKPMIDMMRSTTPKEDNQEEKELTPDKVL